jgi:glycosyltransferase involved in cell wall biosynthesis
VSVVIAAYNAERYIGEAIDSILAQTFPDFELLLVDDGSTDATAAIGQEAAKRDARVVVISQEHLGIPRSRNKGIALSRGEFMAVHDADDVSVPERFARQVDFLDKHPDVAVVGSVAEGIDADGSFMRIIQVPLDHESIRRGVPNTLRFIHGSLLIRRAAVEAVGGYRPEFPVSSDYDLYLRLSERFGVANLPEPLYRYRRAETRISMNRRTLQHYYHQVVLEMARQREEEGYDLLMLGRSPGPVA